MYIFDKFATKFTYYIPFKFKVENNNQGTFDGVYKKYMPIQIV